MAANMIGWEQDADGIVVLTLGQPGSAANVVTPAFRAALDDVLDRIERELASITGVVVTSAKKTFFAGMDLGALVDDVMPQPPAEIFALATGLKAQFRRLETIGRPVVAAINGAALGGGLELALACHRRIAADVPGSLIGLPEVQLGLLPGGGGVVRTVRLVGVPTALTSVLLSGARMTPEQARRVGVIDDVVASLDELVPAAKAWLRANPDSSVQPWDRDGYTAPRTDDLAAVAANLHKQLPSNRMPAPRAIMAAAYEGAQVDFANAQLIESRYFVSLVKSPVAKNMVAALFHDRQQVRTATGVPSTLVWQDPAFDPAERTFTSRLLGAWLSEGFALLAERVDPAIVEQAALQAGYPAGPLSVADRVGLGKGEWAGLRAAWKTTREPEMPFADIQDRLLFAQVAESSRLFADGVITSDAEANVASIAGVGFPAWTGGVRRYAGDPAVGKRAAGLAERYGGRFEISTYASR